MAETAFLKCLVTGLEALPEGVLVRMHEAGFDHGPVRILTITGCTFRIRDKKLIAAKRTHTIPVIVVHLHTVMTRR